MKLILFLALLIGACSCRPTVSHKNRAVFHTVEPLMRTDSTRTGFFVTTSFYDSKYADIEYKTLAGDIVVPNDGTQNALMCRYNPKTMQPLWVAVGGGSGGDAALNYYTVPPENAVFVLGYFEGTAYFPHKAGGQWRTKLESRGNADLFVARYRYDTGELDWIVSGGSSYTDIVFTDMLGNRHKETLMTVDSANVTVYTNVFGPAKFGDKSIEAKLSGSVVRISYDKATGAVHDAKITTSLPCNEKSK